MADQVLFLADEPVFFTSTQYEQILTACLTHNVSDLTFQPNCPVMAMSQGRHFQVTRKKLMANEVEGLANLLYGSNASANVLSGSDLDFSYTHKINDTKKMRFRVNATLINQFEQFGIQISLRALTMDAPLLATLNTSEDIRKLSFIDDGIVVVCGATGSGKSTLLASLLTERAKYSENGEKIITFESPIEYVLPSHVNQSIISQSEIPRTLPNYAYAIRNALRRTPTAIMLGEARDHETIKAVIEAALTGHGVYTTLHSQSVSEAVNRLLMLFSKSEQERIRYDFFSCVKAIIWQKLIPSITGEKRLALREYIILDQSTRETLLKASNQDIKAHLLDAMERNKSSLMHNAKDLYDKNLISKESVNHYTSIYNISKKSMPSPVSVKSKHEPSLKFHKLAFTATENKSLATTLNNTA